MRTSCILRKKDIVPEKAVAPKKGAAAFSCSTGNKDLSKETGFPFISQHSVFCVKSDGTDNFLPKNHCFRPGLADDALALVVRIEGQTRPSNSSGRRRYE